MSNIQTAPLKSWRLLLGTAAVALLAMITVFTTSQPANAALNPLIVITESDGSTNVHPDGSTTDSYTIQLSTAPTDVVWFTISTSYGGSTSFAEISVDGGTTWGVNGVLLIPAGDTSAHTVMVRWANPALTPDDFPPSARVMTVMHPAASWDDLTYDFTDGPNVYVGMELVIPDPELPDIPETPETPTPSGTVTPPLRVETAAE